MDIQQHESFKDLKLAMAIYSIKHSSKKPFMEETYEVWPRAADKPASTWLRPRVKS